MPYQSHAPNALALMVVRCNESRVERPHIYTVIRLARLVQVVKDRLKSLVHDQCMPDRSRSSHSNSWSERASMEPCDKKRSFVLGRGRKCPDGLELGCIDLLRDLDSAATNDGVSLYQRAAEDALFVRYNFDPLADSDNIVRLQRVSTLTGMLLKRTRPLRESLANKSSDDLLILQDDLEEPICHKFIANLEHLLLSLQRVALLAIFCLCYKWISAPFLHSWSRDQGTEGRFKEWPNSKHPLNTTWPWDVKTSLLVLWGVCWMFYYGDGHPEGSPSRTPRTNPYAQDITTRPTSLPSTSTLLGLQAFTTDGLVSPIVQSAYAWPHPNPAIQAPGAHLGRESGVPHPHLGHLDSQSFGYLGGSPPTLSYLSPSSSGASDVPPAAVSWTYPPTRNLAIRNLETPTHGVWQQPASTDDPYAPNPLQGLGIAHSQRETAAAAARQQRQPYHHHQLSTPVAAPPSSNPNKGAFGLNLDFQSNMQDYPSPYSEASVPNNHPPAFALAGQNLSPQVAIMPSPTIFASSVSPESGRRSVEPTRNAEGTLYCAFPQCAENPPVFSRPCEWTKHIETHTRPYVCHEPGCEALKGFTYSGGLQRHKKEVHGHFGGPKAKWLCPHKACKRSVGPEFTRRENLHEHIRRCHRSALPDTAQDPAASSQQASKSGDARKRKRRPAPTDNEDAETDQQSSQDLKQELKRVKRELREKDERLRRLEAQMEQLTRNQVS